MELLIQVNSALDTAQEASKWGESIQVKGLMMVLIVALAVALFFYHKQLSKVNKSRLDEAKEYATNLQKVGEKFMEQTNKMILYMELLKNKNHDN